MKGLVVEGGASRTYFSVGAMDALLEYGYEFDYIVGTSAGISNALNFATRQMGRARRIAQNYVNNRQYSSMLNLLNPKNRSVFGLDYVFRKIPMELEPFDFEALKNFKGKIEAAVTNVETGECEYLPVTADDKSFDTLIASCSLPLMFPIKEINGKKYMDGGITDSIPYKRALEVGCDEIAVLLTRDSKYVKKPGMEILTSSLYQKKYPEFAKALRNRHKMYNEQRKELFKRRWDMNVAIIEPRDSKNWSRMEKDPDMLDKMYAEGYFMARCSMIFEPSFIQDFYMDKYYYIEGERKRR